MSVMTWWNRSGSSKSGRWPDCSKMIHFLDGAASFSNHPLADTAYPLTSCRPALDKVDGHVEPWNVTAEVDLL